MKWSNPSLTHIILLSLFSIITHSLSLIQTTYHYSHYSNEVSIDLNSQNNIAYPIIDLTSEYTWFIFNHLTEYKSDTIKVLHENVTFQYNDFLCQAQKIEDSIGFLNSKKVNLHFFIVAKANLDRSWAMRSALGFAYSFSNPKSSILYQYKENGLIDHAAFSIQGHQRIFLGGILDLDKVNRLHSSCNVIGMNSSWNCEISGAKLVNDTRVLNYKMKKNLITFTTEKDRTLVPKGFFDLMINEFFAEQIKNEEYRFSQAINRKHLYCRDDSHKRHGAIVLVIEGYSYTIEMESFWDCYELACDLNIFENPYGDYWVFGHQFFIHHNTLFDYEDKKIHFYSESGVEEYFDKLGEDIYDTYKELFYVNYIIMISGISLLSYRRYLFK